MDIELLDIIDENGAPLNITKPRTEAHKDGDWHQVAHIYVLNNKDEFLTHLRAPFKDLHPNCWDSRFGGHVRAGQSADETAIRELEEEIGIKAKIEELIKGRIYKHDGGTNKEFINVYYFKLRQNDSIKFNDKEVVEVKWMAVPEILKSAKDNPDKWATRVSTVEKIYEDWKNLKNHEHKKYRKESWISSKVEVRNSPLHGLGLFAKEPIKKDEVVVIWGGNFMNESDALNIMRPGKVLQQIDNDLFDVFDYETRHEDPSYNHNHSCDPNTWMKDEVTITARRDIEAGEELTIDYAMFVIDDDYVMAGECKCGSGMCRHKITGKDWQIKDVQKRYKDHFSPYLNRKIEKSKIILHICESETWETAKLKGEYAPASLKEKGYIHCSEIETLKYVSASHWQGKKDLIVLYIDKDKVKAKIKYEADQKSGRLYPHIYGPINIDAVTKIKKYNFDNK